MELGNIWKFSFISVSPELQHPPFPLLLSFPETKALLVSIVI